MKPSAKKPKAPAITQTSMRASGAKSAACWLGNEDQLQDFVTLPAWRAECYADIVKAYEGDVNFMDLLTAWEQGFDQPPARDEGDIADDINGATEILRDLLKLALQQCVAAGNVGKAESAIRAGDRYIDDIGALAREAADQAQGILNRLNLSVSECWMPVHPDMMPPFEQAVVAWDSSRGKPCAVWRDPDVDGWFSQDDGGRFDDGAITHWRHCHAPEGIHSEGAAL